MVKTANLYTKCMDLDLRVPAVVLGLVLLVAAVLVVRVVEPKFQQEEMLSWLTE